eukprot:CAMPEP_0172675070 /NCGR_PEP_ID=MMETSP1074-20121228/13072_1 /TAXON_ID=2916 /ORGANISM="Ceratium fusus, Strain PA161109" /LENGTH=93 /DNA_ID=CAMNT_0013492517 /DNA_START=142 /DNA_END=421 /DNA_ORIENTATION=-
MVGTTSSIDEYMKQGGIEGPPLSRANSLRYSAPAVQMLRTARAAAALVVAVGEAKCLANSSNAPASWAARAFSGQLAVSKLSAMSAACTSSCW